MDSRRSIYSCYGAARGRCRVGLDAAEKTRSKPARLFSCIRWRRRPFETDAESDTAAATGRRTDADWRDGHRPAVGSNLMSVLCDIEPPEDVNWLKRFMPSVTRQTLPVRSPWPN